MKCKDCKHYNGATMPGAGLCNATQARTFATTVCSMDCSPRKNGKTNRIARPGRNSDNATEREPLGAAVFFSTAVGRSPFLSLRFPFVRKSLRQRLCRRDMLFRCKGIALEEHSSTATLFEHNFSAAFPIFNRPYFADAQYRNYKILPKFLACFSLKGNL